MGTFNLKYLSVIVVFSLAMFGGISATKAATTKANSIGQIKILEGQASILRQEKRIVAVAGADIFKDDEIETNDNGSLGLTFIDGTTISLGPDSTLLVDDFVFEPQDNNTSFSARLLEGTFTYLSGRIAKLSPKKVVLSSPVMTIGIRGTRLLIKVAK